MPNIAFAVNKESQFMQDPRYTHWIAVKRIPCYLKSTYDHYLYFEKSLSPPQLLAFSHLNCVGFLDDRRSTSVYCVFLGKNLLLAWSSKKQQIVSHSSIESEYKALVNASAELMWLQSLLGELGIHLPRASILHFDNIGITYLTLNPISHACTKHIEIDYYFVCDRATEKLLSVKFLSSKDQLANILTKPIMSQRLNLLKVNLNVKPSKSSLRGAYWR